MYFSVCPVRLGRTKLVMCDGELSDVGDVLEQLALHGGASSLLSVDVDDAEPLVVDEMTAENFWLREKLKEITNDRDRLLCEVANLRLELDMGELKRLPDDR